MKGQGTTRRGFLGWLTRAVCGGAAAGLFSRCAAAQDHAAGPSASGGTGRDELRIGLTADAHLHADRSTGSLAALRTFLHDMAAWKADVIIDLGDFVCQCSNETPPTKEMHDCQLASLRRYWAMYSQAGSPAYLAIGNHDVGWIKGGDEIISAGDLAGIAHGGEDITKDELLEMTGLPHRYYSFDVEGCHFIVLDANNKRGRKAVRSGHDGVNGGYWIDDTQMSWLAGDLAEHGTQPKFVFCHQELHHTPPEGSGQGGDVPFVPVGKEGSYVDNGWQVRDPLAADGHVMACFAGHKHRNRWVVYDHVHYITLAATHWHGSYARIRVDRDRLRVGGVGAQRSYDLPLRV